MDSLNAIPTEMDSLITDPSALIGTLRNWAIEHLPRIAGIILLMIITIWIAGKISGRIFVMYSRKQQNGEAQKRADTLNSILNLIIRITIILVGGIMLLSELGIEIGPILAAAGVVGLAVGFGAQNLVQDIISGFFILLEDQIRVGDVVQIAGKGGLVEKITLRAVILRDLSGNVHYVRNGMIDVVTNMTKEFSMYVFNIGVAYRENTDEVVKVIKLVDEDLRSDPDFSPNILDPIEILGVDQFADSAVIIKARYKTVSLKQWMVAREFNRRLKMAFDERDIEIPFPHMTIYAGADKNGTASPLQVSVNKKHEG